MIRNLFAELQGVLPYHVDIRTCEDLKHLGVRCCQTCHGENVRYEMSLIELSDGGKAWVCDSVKQAIQATSTNSLNGACRR